MVHNGIIIKQGKWSRALIVLHPAVSDFLKMGIT